MAKTFYSDTLSTFHNLSFITFTEVKMLSQYFYFYQRLILDKYLYFYFSKKYVIYHCKSKKPTSKMNTRLLKLSLLLIFFFLNL